MRSSRGSLLSGKSRLFITKKKERKKKTTEVDFAHFSLGFQEREERARAGTELWCSQVGGQEAGLRGHRVSTVCIFVTCDAATGKEVREYSLLFFFLNRIFFSEFILVAFLRSFNMCLKEG